jgi:hypothetical protein
MNQPTAEDALKKLTPLVGQWQLRAIGPDGVAWPGEGRSSFEWHDSGAHLIQRTSITVPGAPDSVAIIGCDAANGTYYQLYSDERNVSRVFEMSIDDAEWRLWRDGAPFPQRFKASFEDSGNRIVGRWEKAEGGTSFGPDFDLIYTRIG